MTNSRDIYAKLHWCPVLVSTDPLMEMKFQYSRVMALLCRTLFTLKIRCGSRSLWEEKLTNQRKTACYSEPAPALALENWTLLIQVCRKSENRWQVPYGRKRDTLFLGLMTDSKLPHIRVQAHHQQRTASVTPSAIMMNRDKVPIKQTKWCGQSLVGRTEILSSSKCFSQKNWSIDLDRAPTAIIPSSMANRSTWVSL